MENIESLKDKINECSCNSCANMCRVSPCFPTPDDVIKLIDAGYKDKIAKTTFVDMEHGNYYTLIAPIGEEYNETIARKCVFLKGGLCSLHDSGLKPLEGKVLNHESKDNLDIRIQVLNTWNSEKGKAILNNYKNSSDQLIDLRMRLLGLKKPF